MSALSLAWRRAVGRRRRPGERGAVAVTVAILLAGGVLLGFAALVVDVGQLYAEREELQSGADAAALAVAKACATQKAHDGCISGNRVNDPDPDVYDTAEIYARLNAGDGQADVVEVCGRDPLHRLNACSGANANLTGCLGPAPGGSQPYVEVRVRTKTAGGQFILPPTFAQTFGGGSGGTSVGACARASWSTPNLDPVSFALSLCEFRDATNGTFTTPPRFRDQNEYVIFVHGGAGTSCGSSPPAGWEAPGQFGWIDNMSTCQAASGDLDNSVLHSANGNNWGECGDSGPGNGRLEDLRGSGPDDYTVVLIPIVDGCKDQPGGADCPNIPGPGGGGGGGGGPGGPGGGGFAGQTTLHLAGFAPFVVTGYVRNNGDRQISWQTGNYPCTLGGDGCISGFFVGPLQRTNKPGSAFGARPSIIG
jgi:hypothetical protein